ncbi:MAG: EthD domain-containing protein, partial [SAR324 cluster bacterium]|nr:EthD domain-containing protein [SAR324 cluster bacterium]
PEPYDGVAELWFAAEAQLEQWFANSTPQAIAAGKEIRADERRFIDRARSPFLLGEELPVISGA